MFSALALATTRDLLRRPGVALATLGMGALIVALHQLSASAFDATGALATELSLATLGLYLSVLAGLAAVRATADEGDGGFALEFRAAPVGAHAYLAARLVGILLAVCVLGVILFGFGAFAHVAAGAEPIAAGDLGLALCTAVLQAALVAAVGALIGSVAPPPLALVLLGVFLLAARTAIPALAENESLLAAALPDPARLDLAREVGFGKAVSTASVGVAAVAATLQALALVVVAGRFLATRGR